MVYEIGVTDRAGRRRVDARIESNESEVRERAVRYQARLTMRALESGESPPTVDVRQVVSSTSSIRVGRLT